ncbi:MAG: FMN-binding negative transcriptional regulator [Proteobacteria bacterium]|nr:FMN-binding negative transcriptional regulator [Pseudomonadota bacterium]MDA0913611.1 FMN-binding negative transcriptional regulator [Pseudomonadota bacterium]MDA1032518.1 FMN-binding negative transcriptional regulator [Pseudomonadota bacterium]
MHPNPSFRDDSADLHRSLVDAVGFSTIFLQTPAGPRVAYSALLAMDSSKLQFHLARGNALTRHLEGSTALVVVNGPDAYISARWYADPDQVPTWNYIAVELEGSVRKLDDAELLHQLEMLSDHHEAKVKGGKPWTMDKMSARYLDGLVRSIVGFELEIEARRETVKLSQNKTVEERERVIAGLEQQNAAGIAQAMRGINK